MTKDFFFRFPKLNISFVDFSVERLLDWCWKIVTYSASKHFVFDLIEFLIMSSRYRLVLRLFLCVIASVYVFALRGTNNLRANL